ncbi:serine hydrolase [Novosphingobium sp.]|uniref:serine hydrolase domain-containing protein n=1 Tax=Novosphingobium sp. TaxID=1874826 RepID=UPI001EC0C27B|nr:serine hydrolase [Novosphingobium sp.]MBK6802673.1 beta-lactamase family protein [Novosphingobium sp.]MBK9012474.1 beta-lactamase family protein [Novosphingobium sp.]
MHRLAALLVLFCTPALAAPPATVAVAFDRQSIRPVLAEGLADKASRRGVTADDPVRIASISKLVTALGVMRLVDEGKLDLDRDVSDYLGWDLRNPAWPDKPITLRHLLSHQSSLVDGGELYIIPLEDTLRRRLADPRVWDTAQAPGSGWFHYTNLNFPVIASVMERASGERFDRLMTRLVLKPLKLDACYNWSGCSPTAVSRAVVLYRSTGEVAKDDLKGRAPGCLVTTRAVADACDLALYPLGGNGALFSPQGGLRISMRDLAKIGQMLSRQGKGFLKPASYAQLVKPQWRFDGTNGLGEDGTASGFFCAYGLAIQTIESGGTRCRDALFGDGTARLGHSGDAYGLKSGLWWDPASGRGMAYFTTEVPPDASAGRTAFTRAEESLVERAR